MFNGELNMNYKKHYDVLCDRAKTRDIPNEYLERHHIIPKCMGGNDLQENIVALTAREHFIAHALLAQIYSETQYGYKLASAFQFMAVDSHGGKRQNNRGYAYMRNLFSKNHPTKNLEVREKISKTLKEYNEKRTPQERQSVKRIEVLCECGCGESFIKKETSKRRFIKNHSQKVTNATLERRENQSQKLSEYTSSLTNNEMTARMKNSVGSCDHEQRGKAISLGKRGKKTNQKEIEILKYGKMTENEFQEFIDGRHKIVKTRMTNRRNEYLQRNNN